MWILRVDSTRSLDELWKNFFQSSCCTVSERGVKARLCHGKSFDNS